MKKRTIVLLSLLCLTIILEACNLISDAKEGTIKQKQPQITNQAQQTQINQETLPGSSNTTVSSETYIGETKALEIALAHAGVNNSELLFSRSYLDYDDRQVIYDVEFYAGSKEYDYEIDAVSGNILGFDADMEYDFIPSATPNQNPPASQSQESVKAEPQPVQEQPVQQSTPKPASQPVQQQPAGSSVTLDSAKQIALNKVPGATADHIRIKEDRDDGRIVYEGKIIYNQVEYEFEIDAVTGNITDWDAESIYD